MKWSVVPVTDEFDDNGQDVAGIRKALDKANKELAALKAEKRERTVSDTLSAKGISPKVAKFIPADADVDEWLAENADLFGSAQKAEEQAQVPVADEGVQAVEQAQADPAVVDGFRQAQQVVQDSTARASVAPEIQQLLDAAAKGPDAIAEAAARLTQGGSSADGY